MLNLSFSIKMESSNLNKYVQLAMPKFSKKYKSLKSSSVIMNFPKLSCMDLMPYLWICNSLF